MSMSMSIVEDSVVLVKGVKGRPKKSKKVIEISGEGEDLFARLVASAQSEGGLEESLSLSKGAKEEGAEEKAAKEAEKAGKAEAKAAKEAEKAAKAQAKEDAKKAAEEAKAAKAQAKLAKEAEKAAKAQAKESGKKAPKVAKEKAPKAKSPKKVVAEVEADVVKKIEVDGKKYLKSKATGVIYDYEVYVSTSEQVVVGKWNEASNSIEFEKGGEECEEEYDL